MNKKTNLSINKEMIKKASIARLREICRREFRAMMYFEQFQPAIVDFYLLEINKENKK